MKAGYHAGQFDLSPSSPMKAGFGTGKSSPEKNFAASEL
jgi:hypothetical protein